MTPEQYFTRGIENALREVVDKVVTDEIHRAKAAVERNIREKVGEIALGAMSQYDIERRGSDLLIRVKITGVEENDV